MKLEDRIKLLAQGMGADVKNLNANQGDITSLGTTAKDNLVNAINEIFTLASAVNPDAVTDDDLTTAISALRTELTGGASNALDTFAELEAALGADKNFAATIASSMAKRVRVDDSQNLSTAEKLQACNNIGIGDPDADFVAIYNTAKS